MRRRIAISLVLMMIGATSAAHAQAATHSVTLSWTDTANPATGTTYTVYRAPGLCSGTPTYAKMGTGVTAKTYQDTTVTPGAYCYQVTATVGGVESPGSNSVGAPVPAFAVTNVTATVQ